MPEFSTEVPHALGQEAAKEKLGGFVEGIRERYKGQVTSVEGEWEDDRTLNFGFTAMGIKISGRMVIEPEVVRVTGELPFSAMMFKGKIVGSIKEGLERALS